MLDQPGGAVRALAAVTAGAAQGQWRIAATVQKKQRLLPGRQGRGEFGDQRRGQKTASLDPLSAQIDQADCGQFGHRVAARQGDPLVAAARDVDDGFERRGGGDQHNGDAGQRGAKHRHVAGLIAHPVLLFVGRVVLLVDNDQAQFGERQEQRRARADDDPRAAGGDGPPGVAPLSLSDIGMPLRRKGAKSVAKALQPLRAKRDFRQQHQHLAADGERRGDRGKVGFGLARAGDAVEQSHAETACLDSTDQSPRGDRLVRGKRQTAPSPVRRPRAGGFGGDQALLDEPAAGEIADDTGSAAGKPRRLGGRERR